MVFGGHLENMQIRSIKSHFSTCQHWFLDSAYPNTPDSDLKPFSSQNACTVKTKRLFCFWPDYEAIDVFTKIFNGCFIFQDALMIVLSHMNRWKDWGRAKGPLLKPGQFPQ